MIFITMKPELLEYLVRSCVREVLDQVSEEEKKLKVKPFMKGKKQPVPVKKGDAKNPSYPTQYQNFKDKYTEAEDSTKGSPAPPEAGQGSGENVGIPKDKTPPSEEPREPETPPPSAEIKGIKFINPKDKSKLIDQTKNLKPTNDATLERSLYRLGASVVGSQAKVALSTMRLVKDALRNPSSTLYLYLGKYDPNSEEIFLMADKSLQVAKDASVPPAELTGTPVSEIPPGSQLEPLTATSSDFARRMIDKGEYGVMTPRYQGIDEKLRKAIKVIVTEIISKP
jgi:hypothetical protein